MILTIELPDDLDALLKNEAPHEEKKINLVHIQPGKPMQNGHVESFQWPVPR